MYLSKGTIAARLCTNTAFALALVSISTQSHTHEIADGEQTPTCVSVVDDPDGDGFGWVPHENNPHSCVVTDETVSRPRFATLGNTTIPINVIRPYWDPNADIANRELECTQYRWNVNISDV